MSDRVRMLGGMMQIVRKEGFVFLLRFPRRYLKMRIVIADDDMLVSGALRAILEKDQDIEVQALPQMGRKL